MEARAKITDIEAAKQLMTALGAQYKGHYKFVDHIYAVNDAGYKRLRVYEKNNWDDTKAEYVEKAEQQVVKKQAFPSDDAKELYSYSREGWEFYIRNTKIFIEDVEKIGPMIEIEGTEDVIEKLFDLLGAQRLERNLPLEMQEKV